MTDTNPYEPPNEESNEQKSNRKRVLTTGSLLILMFPASFLAGFTTCSAVLPLVPNREEFALGIGVLVMLIVAGAFVARIANQANEEQKLREREDR